MALELLNAVGMTVDTATDGEEAVTKARLVAYDLVLMDVQMPRLDGLRATRAIRALAGWENRPILAMTANVFADDRQACVAAGMNDFVPKPVDPGTLYAMLLKMAARAKPAPPERRSRNPSSRRQLRAGQEIGNPSHGNPGPLA